VGLNMLRMDAFHCAARFINPHKGLSLCIV
jgi:hypothetical protein